jgi:hypothetical protein
MIPTAILDKRLPIVPLMNAPINGKAITKGRI